MKEQLEQKYMQVYIYTILSNRKTCVTYMTHVVAEPQQTFTVCNTVKTVQIILSSDYFDPIILIIQK